MSFASGFEFAEKHMPAIRKALGELPARIFFDIETASLKQDTQEATDLVLSVSSGDIAVRVRRNKYWLNGLKFGYDWSIRFISRNGGKTEIDKLREGYAKWYFYGYSADDSQNLIYWWLIDLDKIRAAGILDMKWERHPNGDGTWGMYIPIKEIADCITASATPAKRAAVLV